MKNFSGESDHKELQSPFCIDAPIKSLTNISLVLNIAVNSLICITATFGNLLILVTIWRNQSLRCWPSVILLSGLALSDLCVGLFSVPVYIALQVMLLSDKYISCSFLLGSFLLNFYLSGLTCSTLTVISIDRYLAIYFHLRYQELVTERKVKITILSLWITVGLSMFFTLHQQLFKWSTSLFLALFTGIVLFVWIRIYQVVRHHQSQIQDQLQIQQAWQLRMVRLIKSAINTVFILFMFIICYFPFSISLAIYEFDMYASNRTFIYTYNLILLNSSINPLVYCWRNQEIRAAVKQTLAILFCC